jgi:hypothetical protein
LVGPPRLADQHETQQVDRELRAELSERGRQPVAQDVGRDSDVEDQQRERERDDAVAEGLQSSHLDEDLAPHPPTGHSFRHHPIVGAPAKVDNRRGEAIVA